MSYLDTAPRNKHYHCLEYEHEQAGDLYLVSCGMEQCDPGAATGPAVRDGYHLHVILSGSGTLHIGGQVLHPRFSQMFLLKDQEEAYYIADQSDPWNYCWVACNGSDAKDLTEKIGFVDGVYCLNLKCSGVKFFDLVSRMHQKPEMNFSSALIRRGILLEFLGLAMENSQSQKKKLVHPYDMRPEDYVERAIAFIHYNYATIEVSDIAAYIGFTRSYFTTLFRRHAGLSPQEYLIQYRMRKSEEFLFTTGLDIREIAVRVGYDNALSFSREFKKFYGVSPSEYRQQHIAANPL